MLPRKMFTCWWRRAEREKVWHAPKILRVLHLLVTCTVIQNQHEILARKEEAAHQFHAEMPTGYLADSDHIKQCLGLDLRKTKAKFCQIYLPDSSQQKAQKPESVSVWGGVGEDTTDTMEITAASPGCDHSLTGLPTVHICLLLKMFGDVIRQWRTQVSSLTTTLKF